MHKLQAATGTAKSWEAPSMHLSARGELGQEPPKLVWPKGPRRGSLLLLPPLRIEVGWSLNTATAEKGKGEKKKENDVMKYKNQTSKKKKNTLKLVNQ